MKGYGSHHGDIMSLGFFKKDLNAPRPSEHPPVRGENGKTCIRWDHRLQIQNLFMGFLCLEYFQYFRILSYKLYRRIMCVSAWCVVHIDRSSLNHKNLELQAIQMYVCLIACVLHIINRSSLNHTHSNIHNTRLLPIRYVVSWIVKKRSEHLQSSNQGIKTK